MDVGDSMDLGLIGDDWIEFDTTKINWKSSDENVATITEISDKIYEQYRLGAGATLVMVHIFDDYMNFYSLRNGIS